MKICHLCPFVTLILNTRSLTCTGTRGNLLCSPPLPWTETSTSGTSGQNFRRKNQRKHQFISRSESLGSRPSLFKQLWEPRTFGGVVETATIWPGICIAVVVVGFFFFLGGEVNTGCLTYSMESWKQQLFKSVHSLLSAHDGDVKLWDSRNDSAPLTYLSAHLSRVPFN